MHVRTVAPLLLLLAASGCKVAYRTDSITDAEINARGQWTKVDQEARTLMASEPPPAIGPPHDPDRPVRRPDVERKFYDILEVEGVPIPIPRISRGIGFFLGLDWDTQYYYLHGSRTYVILKRGGEAVIVKDDSPDDTGQLPGSRGSVPGRELREAEKLGPRMELPRPDRPTVTSAKGSP